MTANTPEAGMDERAAFEAWWFAAPMGDTSYEDVYGGTYRNIAWIAFQHGARRANLPPPQGDADKVDAERLDWMEANPKRIKRSTGYLGSPDSWAFTDHSGRGMDAASLRDAIDAARQTPGGQNG